MIEIVEATTERPGIADGIVRLLRPESVVIIGMSSKPGGPGHVVLRNMLASGYAGAIHLVGRSGGEIDGLPVLTDAALLPDGIDMAVLNLPAPALLDAVRQCVAKGIRSAVCFAAGFAEMGEEGRAQQREITRVAREGGLALLGPNTIGYQNFVDAFPVIFVPQDPIVPLPVAQGPALAIIAQSGGIASHIAWSMQGRGVPISYMMATGNEAVLSVADLLDHFVDDDRSGAISIYAEQIGDPDAFLAAAARARAAGKPVILLHPGRSAKGAAATSSHTGALAGDHAAMTLIVERAGVAVVETMEELLDLGELLLRFPEPSQGGLGIVTASGALCALIEDYVEPLGFDVPPLSEAQRLSLAEVLPDYLPPKNPLDAGTAIAWQPELIGTVTRTMLSDPAIGSALATLPMTDPGIALGWLSSFLDAVRGSDKPAIYVIHGEDKALPDDLVALARDNRVILMRSTERALRALARFAHVGRIRQAARAAAPAIAADRLPALGHGTQAEWLSKQALGALGIAVPQGGLARSVDEAVELARTVGFPVVMKAQAADLPHKSEVGGVLLNLADEAAVRAGWQKLHDNVAAARPGLRLDGLLVEAMGERGLELLVGARRDPSWGPVLMVGLGGIWVEALGDVRLLTPDMPHETIVAEIRKLRAAKLLDGFRGTPAVDVDAVASVVASIGSLMQARPDIVEIDVNPLVAHPVGQGAIALDALIVTG
jgi:acetate---CoA ligase (ADP-forming)